MKVEMSAQDDQPPRRKVNFDPTINLGHILTVIVMLMSGFAAYNNLDKRVSGLEQLATQIAVRSVEKDQALKENLSDMRGDVKELRHSIDELTKTLNDRTRK